MTAAVDSSAVAGWAQSFPDITAALLTVLPTGAPPHGDVVVVSIGGQAADMPQPYRFCWTDC